MVLSVFCPGLNGQQNPGVAKDVPPASGVPVKRLPGWLAIPVLIAVALMASPAALADALHDYAQECDQAIGVENTVPDFDCDDSTCLPGQPCDPGTLVPTNNLTPSGACDEPNRLSRVCDPGSHFKVLMRSDDAYVVGHCRKKGHGPGEYGDIAVIQYNRKNGATCFYQALGTLSGHVQAPLKGNDILHGGYTWYSPSATAGVGCGQCHDNGPLIRSPYLNQVKGKNALPGSDFLGQDGFSFNNKNQPYAFVGKDFAAWKAFHVEAGNVCTTCHGLGVNDNPDATCKQFTCGTALDFAERATSASEDSESPHVIGHPSHKNGPSKDLCGIAQVPKPACPSPIWMPPAPVQVEPNPANANAAKAIHDCALRLHEFPLPDDPLDGTVNKPCRIMPFAGAYVPISMTPINLMPIYYYLRDDLTSNNLASNNLTPIYYYLLND